MIKLFAPYIPDEAFVDVAKVMASGAITQGKKVDEFEAESRRRLGEKWAGFSGATGKR